MGMTLYEAAKLSRNPIAAGVFKAIVTEDELFSLLPIVPKAGDSFLYDREKALPSVEWVSPTHTSLAESSATVEQIAVPKREIASNFDIMNFVIANQEDSTNEVAFQISKKGRALGRELADTFINGGFVTGYTLSDTTDPFAAITAVTAGPHLDSDRYGPGAIEYVDSGTKWRFRAPGDRTFGDYVTAASDGTYTLTSDNPSKYIKVTLTVLSATADGHTQITFSSSTNEPDGVKKLVSTDQVRSSSGNDGDALDFAILDELIDSVKVRDNLAFVMNGALRRKFKALARAMGGTRADQIMIPSFGKTGASVERPMLAYEGVPILKNDNIASDESKGSSSTLSSVYLVNLSEDTGVYAGAFGGASQNLDLDPFSRVVLGVQILPVGQLEGKNAQRWRMVWYGGFAVGSDLSVARASEIKTA